MVLELTLSQMRTLYLIGSIIAIFTGFYLYKFLFYVRENKSSRFRKLLGKGKFMFFGVYMNPQDVPGFMIRSHKYIFNDLDTKDKKMNHYKKMLRIGIVLSYLYLIFHAILFLF